MVFIERVRIGIPSREEIQELESNVMQMERLASRSATAGLGIQEAFETGPVLPSALTRRRRNAALGRSGESSSLARQRLNGASRSSANPVSDLVESEFSRMQAEIAELKQFEGDMQSALGFLLNPAGNAQSRALAFAGGIPGVGIAAALAPIIYNMIVQQHGAGGIFDVTKQQLDDVRSFVGLEKEIAVKSAETLFLGNIALRQGIPTNITSNTQDLRDGLRRYTLQTNEFGR